MADYPVRGETPWDIQLRDWILERISEGTDGAGDEAVATLLQDPTTQTGTLAATFVRDTIFPPLFRTIVESIALSVNMGSLTISEASGYRFVIVDSAGRMALGIRDDATVEITRLALGPGSIGFEALSSDITSRLRTDLPESSGWTWAIMDNANRISIGGDRDGTVIADSLTAAKVKDGIITVAKLAPEVTTRLVAENGRSPSLLLENPGSPGSRSLYANSTRTGRRALLTASGDPRNAVAMPDERAIYTTDAGDRWSSGDGKKGPNPLYATANTGVLFGDSFAAPGNGMAGFLNTWLPGTTWTTQAEAGTSPVEIGLKFGLEAIITLTGNQIPAGTGTVVANVLDPVDGYKDDMNNAVNFVGEVRADDGTWVAGTLSRPYPPIQTYPLLDWTFTRTTAGTAKAVSANGVRFRSTVGPPEWNKHQVWWMGRNMLQEFGLSKRGPLAVAKAMAECLTPYVPRFIVLSPTNHPLTLGGERLGTQAYDVLIAVNKGLKDQFGERYMDVRSRLIKEGLSSLAVPITPTAQDLIDISQDMVPASLRDGANNVHLTLDAYNMVAGWVADYMKNTMGWFA